MSDDAPSAKVLALEIEIMSDNQLIDRAAAHNAALRRGRKMMASGQRIIDANIDAFVMIQNALHARIGKRIEVMTDKLDPPAPA